MYIFGVYNHQITRDNNADKEIFFDLCSLEFSRKILTEILDSNIID